MQASPEGHISITGVSKFLADIKRSITSRLRSRRAP